jgi:hypothetical protein
MEFIPEWPFIRIKEQKNVEDTNGMDSIPWVLFSGTDNPLFFGVVVDYLRLLQNSSFNGEGGNLYLSSDELPRNTNGISP